MPGDRFQNPTIQRKDVVKMKRGHRRMPAYGECEHGGRYILDDYTWSRNLKKKARAANARLSRESEE